MTAKEQWQLLHSTLGEITQAMAQYFPTLFKIVDNDFYYYLGSETDEDNLLIEIKGMVDPFKTAIVSLTIP